MNDPGKLKGFGEEIERRLQLRTSPIAVKFLEKESDVPPGAIRPRKHLGHHLALCQAFAFSRREGMTVAMLKGDHWCYIPVISTGLSQPPDMLMEGHADYPGRVADLAAAKKMAVNAPCLTVGKYIGIVSSPLKKAVFEPDIVVIYCDSAQLRCLLVAVKYKMGKLVTSTLEPSGACVQCTVPVMLNGECQVTVPCGGDRRRALARDDEVIFSVPGNQLEDLVLGLRHFDEIGAGYTECNPEMIFEYEMPDTYVKLGKMVGLDIP